MASLSYSATFGHQVRRIDIEQVAGGGGEETWHVLIGRFYYGSVTRIQGELAYLPGPGSTLQGDDIGALLEIITALSRPSPSRDRS